MPNQEKSPTILAVDDERSVLETFKIILKDDFNILTCSSGREALQIIECGKVDLVLLDLKMPDIDGMDVLRSIKKAHGNIPVVMATAIDSARAAVEALRLGAANYITKPFDADELAVVIRQALENNYYASKARCFPLQNDLPAFETMIGQSKKIKEIYAVIEKMAKNDATILISGESGTGKELIARAVHFTSFRKDHPFIAINCASIPDNLLESELFGYEKGAFTGAANQKLGMVELANEGTLFLDEVSELKLDMQAKLLRAIEQKEIKRLGGTKTVKINLRLISATNIDLKKAVQEKRFRQDLYYRLNVVPILVPPLRERKDDIPILAGHFLNVYNQKFRKEISGFTKEALESLKSYDWQGNIRELKNIIERLVVLKEGGVITLEEMPFDIFIKNSVPKGSGIEGGLKNACNNFQKEYIEAVLEKSKGNRSKAAKILGIHRNALFNKLKSLGLKEKCVAKSR